MPTGGGDPKNKSQKKKSKKQREKELRRPSPTAAPSMSFEVVRPKRKERDT